jgi:hypothetical protein
MEGASNAVHVHKEAYIKRALVTYISLRDISCTRA